MAAATDRPGDPGAPNPNPSPEQLLATPVGHELQELARRILGPGPVAVEVVRAALAEPLNSRVMAISRTAVRCRSHPSSAPAPVPAHATLSEAVAAEIEHANATLPNRQREALALRELSRLSYPQIARVMDLEIPAVGLLLARARLGLREALRGRSAQEPAACAERERSLRLLARRQDSEALDAADDAWILGHLVDCPGCERAHAMMLEASFRYRVWGRG